MQANKLKLLRRAAQPEEVENSVAVAPVTKNSNKKISKFVWLSLFAIIVCVNHFFWLVPWAHLHGRFNSSDIGLLVLGVMLVLLFLSPKSKACFNNGFSYLLLAYICMILGQVANAAINYDQSIIDGLIAIRHQFYYLSFFVFLMIFEDLRCIKQFLNFMMVLGVILVIIGLINYFGLTLYYHQWAEGHGERGGVTRAFFAGMGVITFSLFWPVSRWLVATKIRLVRELSGMMLILAHVMRQTRGIIISISVTVLIMLINERKVKTLIFGAIIIAAMSAALSMYSDKNILIDAFVSAYEDISEGGGTWAPRLEQLKTDITIFMEHPIIGGGTYAIRLDPEGKTSGELRQLVKLHANSDLGYTHWLKAYGIIGGIWLVCLYALITKYIKQVLRSSDREMRAIGLMGGGYSIFVIFSFITQPHFIIQDRILLICMALAIMVRIKLLITNTPASSN